MAFESWSKRHLADYKTDRLGIQESGLWKQNNAKYPHILPQQLYKLNILETYRKEFWEYRSTQSEIKLHKDFHHLNSSQAMCFNLFFPFIADSDLQKLFLMEVLKSKESKITACSFEKILDSSEGTNFDFFIQFENGPRYLFEIKYTEKEFGKAVSDKRREDKLLKIYKPRLQGLVKPEALESTTFFQNYQILRNVSYLERAQADLLFLIFPKANQNLREAIPSIMKLLTEETRQRLKIQFIEDITTTILGSPVLKNPIIAAHYSLFAEKYLPRNELATKRELAHDFSNMDTGIYWNEARKYMPSQIKVLFIGESPPAFRNQPRMAYFYFKESAGDLLFASMMKAVFDVDYKKNPFIKESLLKRFAEEKRCFLIDAVPFPINRDANGNKVKDNKREKIIETQKRKLQEMLYDLEKIGKVNAETGIVLLKETVHNALYDDLNERYKILNPDYIGFPRWHGDQLFIEKIRQTLGCRPA